MEKKQKPKQRRPRKKQNPNNPMSGYNSRMIALILHSEGLPKIDINDPEQVKNRLSEYFDFCIKYDLFPSVCGMANWLGVHRDTIHSWRTGERRKGTKHQEIINQAYTLIESVLVDKLMNDSIPSPVGIFFLKSVFGYKDRFDIGLGAGSVPRPDPLADLRVSEEELAKRYIESIPEEENVEGSDQIDGNGTGDQDKNRVDSDHL